MKRHILTILFLSDALLLAAQTAELNPEVNVTNEYKSSPQEQLKQDFRLSVPDTVMHIDYDFDYSVFENPYRGAYEFSAYEIAVKPQKTVPTRNSLFLRAGAGYPLYPEFYGVLSAGITDRISLSLYQDFDGYCGEYWNVGSSMLLKPERYKGRDLSEKAGAALRISGERKNVLLEGGYRGLYNSDWIRRTDFHSMSALCRISDNRTDGFAQLSLRFSSDRVEYPLDAPVVNDFEATVCGRAMAAVPGHPFSVSVDYSFGAYLMPGIFNARKRAAVSLSPHLNFSLGRFDLKAGFKADYYGRPLLVPDIRIGTELGLSGIRVFAGATGGERVNTYSSLKEYDHFFNPSYSTDFLSVTSEKVNLFAGFDGAAGPYLSYSLRGGYSCNDSMPFEAVEAQSGALLPRIILLKCNYAYLDLGAALKSDRFDFDTKVLLRKTSLDGMSRGVDLPLITSDTKVEYNIRKRIFLALNCRTESERRFICAGESVAIPFSADLGACAEYRTNSCWSFWIKGGNLLNMDCRISALHVERGTNITLGVCLSL